MDKKEHLKNQIKRVEHEIKNEENPNKKQRLNKYKNKLEIELRDYIFFQKGGQLCLKK